MSQPIKWDEYDEEVVVADIQAALDYLQSTQIHNFEVWVPNNSSRHLMENTAFNIYTDFKALKRAFFWMKVKQWWRRIWTRLRGKQHGL